MSNIENFRTLAVAAVLLLTPMIAVAGPTARPASSGTLAAINGSDVDALRCSASAARSEMIFLTCLAGCARHISDADSHVSKCEEACIDRRGARDESLSCQVEGDVPGAGLPEEAAPGLAQTQGFPTKLNYSQRQRCYGACRQGGMSIAFCDHSCF